MKSIVYKYYADRECNEMVLTNTIIKNSFIIVCASVPPDQEHIYKAVMDGCNYGDIMFQGIDPEEYTEDEALKIAEGICNNPYYDTVDWPVEEIFNKFDKYHSC